MKNIYVGLTLLLVSAIIYGSTLISASIYSKALADTSWDGRYGIFGTALREVGIIPLTIAILFGIIGVILIINSLRKNK